MSALLPLIPIYGLILIGFLSIRLGYLPASTLPAISQFTLKICLPVLVAGAVSRVGSLTAFNWSFIAAYGAASLVVLLVSVLVLRRAYDEPRSRAWTLSMGASCSNSLFLGYPAVQVVFPQLADRLLAWVMTVENMVMIPLIITMATIHDRAGALSPGAAIVATLRRTATNPIVVGLLAGFFLAGTGLQLPEPVARILQLISAGAPLLALYLVGGLVASAPAGSMSVPVVLIALGKLILHPAMVLLAFAIVPGIPRDIALGGLLFAGMPMLATFTVFAAAHGGQYTAASALVVATALGAVTVSLLVLMVA